MTTSKVIQNRQVKGYKDKLVHLEVNPDNNSKHPTEKNKRIAASNTQKEEEMFKEWEATRTTATTMKAVPKVVPNLKFVPKFAVF